MDDGGNSERKHTVMERHRQHRNTLSVGPLTPLHPRLLPDQRPGYDGGEGGRFVAVRNG